MGRADLGRFILVGGWLFAGVFTKTRIVGRIFMNRVGPAIIGTVILIGIVRLLSNKAVDVLDVVGATALSLGIALWILYIVKNRARR